ncbi:glycine receptor subunit alpha-4 isoform X11 [Harpegnathos saltator]|uniref:glycine receptor subunit alpha-4 isoform X11 n=1 Tax=Harpegnathos saltator TaxID=610380 RepID=UPI000948B847|nr:glycine receptor subunit alpha-4 isoform X11 [Harpegnathos saltator]
MGWVALGRCAGGGGRLSSILSLSLTSLASSLIFTSLCILTLAFTLVTLARAEDIFEEGKSDKEILDDLLLSKRYDKRLLPPVQDAGFCCGMRWPGDTTGLTNRSSTFSNDPKNLNNNHYTPHQYLRTHLRGTLTVNVSVLLLSLASPDESSLKYEVEFLLQQQWYDPRLRYSNRSKYEFLNAIHHYEDIWLPDTYFIMHGDFKDPIIPVHFALRIYRNGTVNYLMRRHLILSCQGRLNIFPFDDPLCSFAIESISYEQTAITYVWKNDEGTLRKSPSLTSLNAYLIKNQTITCPIKVSWRGVTTMLNFFTTSTGFRGTLPVVSNLTAMNVWDGVCMCFIYASLLEFVCVNYVGRKRPMHNVVYRPGENPVTQRLPAVLSRIGIILASPLKREGGATTGGATGPNEIVTCTNCGPNPCTHTATNGCTAELRKKEPPHPIRVAKTIDVIARITFPVAYFVFLTFFFVHYKGIS